jgi:hypothetical protein
VFSFYAYFRPFANGSLAVVTTTTPFTVVNLFTDGDLPSGTNSYNVPIYNVFSQETPPAIGDISDLSTTLAGLSTIANVDRKYTILDALQYHYAIAKINQMIRYQTNC